MIETQPIRVCHQHKSRDAMVRITLGGSDDVFSLDISSNNSISDDSDEAHSVQAPTVLELPAESFKRRFCLRTRMSAVEPIQTRWKENSYGAADTLRDVHLSHA